MLPDLRILDVIDLDLSSFVEPLPDIVEVLQLIHVHLGELQNRLLELPHFNSVSVLLGILRFLVLPFLEVLLTLFLPVVSLMLQLFISFVLLLLLPSLPQPLIEGAVLLPLPLGKGVVLLLILHLE